MHATPTPSEDVPVKTNTSARRYSLWNGALRLFRRKTRYETYTDLLLHHRVGVLCSRRPVDQNKIHNLMNVV